jgi:hypothetical protein
MRDLQLARERLRGELDMLQSERLRTLAELARMQNERQRLIGEIVRLRDEVARERASAAAWREQEEAAAQMQEEQLANAEAANGAGVETSLVPHERHAIRDFFFSRFDDPARGWLLRLSGTVVALIVLFAVSHKIVFSVFNAAGSWRWLGETLQWLMIVAGATLAGGFMWAQRTFYRADRAGRVHSVPLPAAETWQRVGTALRGTARHGALWHIETAGLAPGETGFELRAFLHYSTAQPGVGVDESDAKQTVTFRCRAHAVSAGETRIAWDFGVRAPTWWLVPAARVVRDLRKRIEMDLSARV